jgi:hypothetical protein
MEALALAQIQRRYGLPGDVMRLIVNMVRALSPQYETWRRIPKKDEDARQEWHCEGRLYYVLRNGCDKKAPFEHRLFLVNMANKEKAAEKCPLCLKCTDISPCGCCYYVYEECNYAVNYATFIQHFPATRAAGNRRHSL